MPGTTLADVIVPELFNPYVVNRTMELSALYQSGIITTSPEFTSLASEAARTHNMPFFEDLTGDSQNIEEGKTIEFQKITSNKDVSTTIMRQQKWSATDLSGALAGSDPMRAIGDLVAGYWARQYQKELISILSGIFGSTTMTDHVLDVSGGTGKAANISATTFMNALQLLGDAQDQLTAVAMHSATKTYLKQQNLIATERDSTDVEFDTYQGRRVVVDDGCPVDGGVYTTYLFGQGAVAFGEGSPVDFVQTETRRDPDVGAGVNMLYNRHCFIMHPRGVAWQNKVRAAVESPTRAELADATNWARVYEPKQIRLVALKHKLG
jgi:hypothetical protein